MTAGELIGELRKLDPSLTVGYIDMEHGYTEIDYAESEDAGLFPNSRPAKWVRLW